MMRQEAPIAFLSPGQGTPMSPEWAHDPAAERVLGVIQKAFPDGPDVKELLQTPPDKRPINALNAHILLATVMGIARERLQPQLKDRPVVVSGHSAGLPNSLGMSEFYADGVEGLAKAMGERGKLLTKQQEINPGEMHAVRWNGKNGFEEMTTWVSEQNEIIRGGDGEDGVWIACFNYENGEEAQVVITSKEGLMKQLKKMFPKETGKPIPLSIALGAHSPLVLGAKKEYHRYLLEQLRSEKIQSLTKSGVIYVSDHPQGRDKEDEKEKGPLIARNAEHIVRDLSEFHRPVQFQDSIKRMYDDLGIRSFYEIGGKVLTNFIGKMGLENVTSTPISTPKDLDALETALANRVDQIIKPENFPFPTKSTKY